MNRALLLLTLYQGFFLTNNVTFIAVNGLVGLALAPSVWMATLSVTAYVAGSSTLARSVPVLLTAIALVWYAARRRAGLRARPA